MRAVYGQIYEDLLAQIESGEYPYQGFIPSEAELCERYQCSHNTARRAVRLLAQEGYVQPINGKGVRVIYLPADREDFSIGGIETFKFICRPTARTSLSAGSRRSRRRRGATTSRWSRR